MNESEPFSGGDFKSEGTWMCVLAILARLIAVFIFLHLDCSYITWDVFLWLPFYIPFLIPVPLVALILFRKAGRTGQLHALTGIISYIILSIAFWVWFSEMDASPHASADGKGLFFLWGSFLIDLICAVLVGVFSLIYFICRKVKADAARK